MAVRIWIWKKVEKSQTGGFFTSVLNLNMQIWECTIEPAGFEKLTSCEHIRIFTVDEINRSMQRLQPIPRVALKILRIINEDNYDITSAHPEMANFRNIGVELRILIVKILNVFLWLKFSPALILQKFFHLWTDTN